MLSLAIPDTLQAHWHASICRQFVSPGIAEIKVEAKFASKRKKKTSETLVCPPSNVRLWWQASINSWESS
jgi:hypothetical protein